MAGEEQPIWYLVITVIVGGGGMASMVTYVFDKLAKKREETVDMAKFRIERIGKKYNDYMDLVRYSYDVYNYSRHFTTTLTPNNVKLLLSTLKFCEVFERIVDRGNFLLGDQDAESLLSELNYSLIDKIEGIFSTNADYWKFRSLNSMKSVSSVYADIQNTTTDYHYIYDKFFIWLSNQNNKDAKKDIEENAYCSLDLLVFELNTVFTHWYNTKFESGQHVDSESVAYLRTKFKFASGGSFASSYPKYCRKIDS